MYDVQRSDYRDYVRIQEVTLYLADFRCVHVEI